MRRIACFAGALLVTLSPPAPAAAQPDTTSAQALFDQARDAMKRGEISKACLKFAESQRLDPQPGTLANLALCEEKIGKTASAWTHARDAADQLGPGDERTPILRALVSRAEKRLPRLVVRLSSTAPADTVVTRDGVELGAASLGVPLPADPGDHVLTAKAPGRRMSTVTVTVVEAETLQVEIGPDDAPPNPSPGGAPPPTEASSGSPRSRTPRTAAYVAGGVGAVGALVAVGTGIVLAGKQSTVRASCDVDTKVCSGPNASDARDQASAGRSLLPVYYGGLAVAAVGLGAGAYLLFSSDDSRTTSVRLGPGSVAVGGKF